MYNHVRDTSLRKDDRIVVPLDDLLQWNVWPQFLKICRKCTVCVCAPHPLANAYILQMDPFFTYIYRKCRNCRGHNILWVKLLWGEIFLGEVSP